MKKDKVTLQRIPLLHPKVREEAMEIYDEICSRLTGNTTVRFTHTLRTFAEQDALFAQGRTKAGKIITRARGGQSYHNFGLAIDFCLLIDKNNDWIYEEASWDNVKDSDKDGVADWMEVVVVFKMYGWTWGGDFKTFKDGPHFEKTFDYTTPQLRKLFIDKKVDKNNYVLI